MYRTAFAGSPRAHALLIVVALGLLACLPTLSGCGDEDPSAPVGDTTIQVDTSLAQFSALRTVGGWVALESGDLFGLPANGVFILRLAPTVAQVLDRTCTFEQCQVDPFVGGTATCPCNGSSYSTDGVPVQGPAIFPLTTYPSTIEGDIIEFTV